MYVIRMIPSGTLIGTFDASEAADAFMWEHYNGEMNYEVHQMVDRHTLDAVLRICGSIKLR